MINKEEYLRGVEAATNLIQIATKEDNFGDYILIPTKEHNFGDDILKIIHEHLDDCENGDTEDVSEDYVLGYSDTLQSVADSLEKVGYKD